MDAIQSQGDRPEEPNQLDRLRWLYEELLRVERHWTEQVQNQQQRILTLLTVTGILLAFLAGASFLTGKLAPPVRLWWARFYVASLIVLCFALLMGIMALRSRIPIGETSRKPGHGPWAEAVVDAFRCFLPKSRFPVEELPVWLDAQRIQQHGQQIRDQVSLLSALCASLAETQRKANHPGVLLGRRLFMNRQIVLLIISLVLLVVALAGFLAEAGGLEQAQ